MVLEGSHIGPIDGAHLIFSHVNEVLAMQGKPAMFKLHLVGNSKDTLLKGGLYAAYPELLLHEVEKTDLIIIPAAIQENMQKTIELNKDFIPWIIRQHKSGAEVASLCIGAFLLASTGLLNGISCATHWMFANDFRKMFPEVNLVTEKIITDEQGLYSSGGAFSYLNLLLYIVEKYAGRQMAVQCAKTFNIDIDRSSQSPFIMFRGQKTHEDEPIRKAQEYIEKNYENKITVDQLASMLALGRRNLERRFKKATDNTVVEYIQRVKIEAAKMSLESAKENVNEVMYKVGYTDTKAFRNTFKRITGLSPIQYRNKYNRELAV